MSKIGALPYYVAMPFYLRTQMKCIVVGFYNLEGWRREKSPGAPGDSHPRSGILHFKAPR